MTEVLAGHRGVYVSVRDIPIGSLVVEDRWGPRTVAITSMRTTFYTRPVGHEEFKMMGRGKQVLKSGEIGRRDCVDVNVPHTKVPEDIRVQVIEAAQIAFDQAGES